MASEIAATGPADELLSGQQAELQARQLPFEFTGSGSEYFRIWIVNVLLTILTLGVYSAWAKVRRLRYFYRSTRLAGDSFDYHASPIAILKGRILAVALLALYLAASYLLPGTELLLLLLLFVMSPVLVVRARIFHLRNSSYRGIRFDFEPDYSGAYGAIVGLYLLAIVTLGIGYPYAAFGRARFMVANSSFGTSRFAFGGQGGDFYAIYLKAGLILALAVGAALSVVIQLSPERPPPADPDSIEALLASLPFTAIVLLAYAVPFVYLRTRSQNLILSNTTVERHRLSSTLRVRDMLWIYLSNLVAIVASLGLLTPWARVRVARYRLAHLTLQAHGSIDEFFAAERSARGAAGQEVGEAFDIDLGL